MVNRNNQLRRERTRKKRRKLANSSELWPKVKYSTESEPKFLFIITPPNSGSTALAKILNTAPNSMILNKRAEGQWLVPGMSQNRWNPDRSIDWESVKSVWLSTYQQVNTHVETLNLIIEKSPATLVVAEELQNQFNNSVFLAFNRNPYANCSSSFHRYSPNYENFTKEKRMAKLTTLANRWLFRNRKIRELINQFNITHFTYEEFCKDTSACIQKVIDICPELLSIDIDAQIKVKDYDQQGIVNQNQRQIDRLDADDISAISSVISQDEELLKFFGYQMI